MNITKQIIIIGATSAIAEHCARLWAEEGAASLSLTLVARNLEKLTAISRDLTTRYPHLHVVCLQAHFTDPKSIQTFVDDIVQAAAPDIVLIAHGVLPDQKQCQEDLALCYDTLLVTGVSPILFTERFAYHMEKRNRGTIALIGSIAGDRGRQSNYIYGAAKGLLERHAEGLQHRLARAKSNVKMILIKPGPTDTPMVTHLKQKGLRFTKVERVAKQIVACINQDKPVVYVPTQWKWIMTIIRYLPNFIFHRLGI